MSPQYGYTQPAALSSSQETVDHPNPSVTPTPRRQCPPEGRPVPSGFQAYPDSTRQPTSFTYPPLGSTAPPLYNTTSSGWPAPSGVLRFGGQNPVSAASMMTAGSHYQSSEYNNSTPPELMASSRDLRQYSAPFGENTTSGYQNRDSSTSGPTALSGFGVNIATAVRNPYPGQTALSVQRETSNYFPASSRGRPQSMYPPIVNSSIHQYETEEPVSSRGDAIDEMMQKVEKTILRGQPHRRSSVGTLL